MKLTKKIKIGISFILMSVAILVTFGTIRTNAAVSTDTITYHYSVYTKETWLKYLAAKNNESFIVFEDLKVNDAMYAEDVTPCLEDYTNSGASLLDSIGGEFYTSDDLQKNGEEYATTGSGRNLKYVLKAGAVLSSYSTDAEVYGALNTLFPSKDMSSYPTITQAVPGDEIVVAVNAELMTGRRMRQAVVLLDLERYAQGGNLTRYYSELVESEGFTASNLSTKGIGLNIGWTSPSTSVYTDSPAFVGAIGFTIATGVTGNMKIEFLKKERQQEVGVASAELNKTCFVDGNAGSTSASYGTQGSQFREDNCVISVAGLSDDVGLTDITVEGKSCLSTSSSVNVNGDATLQYKGSDTSDGTANVSITVQNSGKLVANSVKYGKTLSSQTSSATQSGNSFSVNMNALNAGESYIATFQVESSSGNVRKWYAVELPKAKDTNCDLDSLGFSGTNGLSLIHI